MIAMMAITLVDHQCVRNYFNFLLTKENDLLHLFRSLYLLFGDYVMKNSFLLSVLASVTLLSSAGYAMEEEPQTCQLYVRASEEFIKRQGTVNLKTGDTQHYYQEKWTGKVKFTDEAHEEGLDFDAEDFNTWITVPLSYISPLSVDLDFGGFKPIKGMKAEKGASYSVTLNMEPGKDDYKYGYITIEKTDAPEIPGDCCAITQINIPQCGKGKVEIEVAGQGLLPKEINFDATEAAFPGLQEPLILPINTPRTRQGLVSIKSTKHMGSALLRIPGLAPNHRYIIDVDCVPETPARHRGTIKMEVPDIQ